MDKDLEKSFSQRWEIFRIATHEKGGIDLALAMQTKYSTKQLFEVLEILDAHDALKEQAVRISKAEANKK